MTAEHANFHFTPAAVAFIEARMPWPRLSARSGNALVPMILWAHEIRREFDRKVVASTGPEYVLGAMPLDERDETTTFARFDGRPFLCRLKDGFDPAAGYHVDVRDGRLEVDRR